MKNNYEFSVLLLVYCKDNPVHFQESLDSVISQSLPANEIVIVCDGPLTKELNAVLRTCKKKTPCINVYRLKKNLGHGKARAYGVEKCKYNLIALMDADDISVPTRFEKEIEVIKNDGSISVVGGFINEFSGNINNIVGIREVPKTDAEIKTYMKKRCPMNQVTVLFKKNDVLSSGNYIDWYCEEDYYLWIRMAENNYKFYNLQENLVSVRVDNGMYNRRGGLKYFQSEKRVQKYMLKHRIIGFPLYLYNVFIRFIAEVIITNRVRGFLYKIFLRRKKV